MRVDENVRKTVLFIGRCNREGRFTPVGTAFLMVVNHHGNDFDFVVTARHNLEAFGPSEQVYLRVNNIGGTTTLPTQLADWQIHPARKNYVDVAVIPTSFIETSSSDKFDVSRIPESMLCTEEILENLDVAPGSDIVTIGLFTSHANTTHNVPIVRAGTVAAMRDPNELVYTKRGHMDAYLVELRSIGGLSGSPVFLQTPLMWAKDGRVKKSHEMKTYYLLGLMRGHFNVENEDDAPTTKKRRDEEEDVAGDRINSGIGVVVPVDMILATIKRPELVLWMDEKVATSVAASGDDKNPPA